jgi:hypothetical protein
MCSAIFTALATTAALFLGGVLAQVCMPSAFLALFQHALHLTGHEDVGAFSCEEEGCDTNLRYGKGKQSQHYFRCIPHIRTHCAAHGISTAQTDAAIEARTRLAEEQRKKDNEASANSKLRRKNAKRAAANGEPVQPKHKRKYANTLTDEETRVRHNAAVRRVSAQKREKQVADESALLKTVNQSKGNLARVMAGIGPSKESVFPDGVVDGRNTGLNKVFNLVKSTAYSERDVEMHGLLTHVTLIECLLGFIYRNHLTDEMCAYPANSFFLPQHKARPPTLVDPEDDEQREPYFMDDDEYTAPLAASWFNYFNYFYGRRHVDNNHTGTDKKSHPISAGHQTHFVYVVGPNHSQYLEFRQHWWRVSAKYWQETILPF